LYNILLYYMITNWEDFQVWVDGYIPIWVGMSSLDLIWILQMTFWSFDGVEKLGYDDDKIEVLLSSRFNER
jgi:hypothetical protein